MTTGDDECMDLARDAHLRQALRHAPDADAAPPPGLSAVILAQARAAVRPAPAATAVPWWQRLWGQLATPAFGGAFASLMLAGAIGVMWQDGPPPEALPESGREMAKAPVPAPAPAPATATATAATPADKLSELLPVPPMQAAESHADKRATTPAEPSRPAAPAHKQPSVTGTVETDNAAPGRTQVRPEAGPPEAPARSSEPAAALGAAATVAPSAAPVVAPADISAPAPAPAPAPPPPPAAPPALAPAKARAVLPEALRDSDNRALMARRESAGATPQADPLAAPWAALAGAAADDPRSFEARSALVEARRLATGPWLLVEALAADQGRTILAPDGRPLGRLHIDDRSVTWQGAGGPAWRSPRSPVPR